VALKLGRGHHVGGAARVAPRLGARGAHAPHRAAVHQVDARVGVGDDVQLRGRAGEGGGEGAVRGVCVAVDVVWGGVRGGGGG